MRLTFWDIYSCVSEKKMDGAIACIKFWCYALVTLCMLQLQNVPVIMDRYIRRIKYSKQKGVKI